MVSPGQVVSALQDLHTSQADCHLAASHTTKYLVTIVTRAPKDKKCPWSERREELGSEANPVGESAG